MDINITEEKVKVEQDLVMLQKQLQVTNQQREQIIQQMVMRRGILQYLNQMNGGEAIEPSGTQDT